MRIACVGAGPAGLYLGILAKLRDPDAEVSIFERHPPGVTHGWGVVFWDDFVADLRANDPVTADAIVDASLRWSGQLVDLAGAQSMLPGGGYGLSRHTMLDILSRRATELGVRIHHEHEITSLAQLPAADVVVAADGVGSRVRRFHERELRPQITMGRNKYVWLATPRVFEAFTFAFVPTDAGWIWCHAYGYSAAMSTFIVECTAETWRALGFHRLDAEQSLRRLEELFARHLDGCRLVTHAGASEGLPWLSFRHLTNQRWWTGNVVLVGDAAHTTHFSIGSGTRLAIKDAIALADNLDRHRDVASALAAYERERRVGMVAPLRESRLSARWFENIPRYTALSAPEFHAVLLRRRARPVQHMPPALTARLIQVRRIAPARRLYQWGVRFASTVEARLAGSHGPRSSERMATVEKDA